MSSGTSPAGVQERKPPALWTLAQRLAFRFGFIYLAVYGFSGSLFGDIPGLNHVFQAADRRLVLWFAGHVLRLNRPIANFPDGSGDTTFNYVQVLWYAVVALAGAALWSVLDHRRPSYAALYEALRIWVRYVLAFALLAYGLDKIFKSQFPEPDIDVLLQTYGNSSPMRLMWTFMGYSTPYTVFAGLSEVLPGLLLLFRRTTTLGALIGGTVMTNVVLLNFSFDVPVKVYSTHLLLMCIFLLLPDLRRLANVLLFNRPAGAVKLELPWESKRWARAGRLVVKPLYILIGVFLVSNDAISAWKQWGDRAPRPALYGAFEVEASVSGPALSPDAWRRVFVNRHQQLFVELADHTLRRFAIEAAGQATLVLTEEDRRFKLAYARPDDDHLLLKGRLENQPFELHLRKLPERDFPLMRRGFHWINEFPYNR